MIYTDDNRGTIQNRDAAKQIIDFHDIRYDNNITPTDIDGFFEINDRIFVFFEFKYQNGKLPYGQRLALERLASALEDAGKHAIVFQCEHNTQCQNDVVAANAVVKQVYYKKQWFPIKHSNNRLKELCDSFIEKCKAEDLKTISEYDIFGRQFYDT